MTSYYFGPIHESVPETVADMAVDELLDDDEPTVQRRTISSTLSLAEQAKWVTDRLLAKGDTGFSRACGNLYVMIASWPEFPPTDDERREAMERLGFYRSLVSQ